MKRKLTRLLAAMLVGILTVTSIGVVPAAANEASTPTVLRKEDFNGRSELVSASDDIQWKSDISASLVQEESNKYISISGGTTRDKYLRVGLWTEFDTQKPTWIAMNARIGEITHKKVLFQMTNTDGSSLEFFYVQDGTITEDFTLAQDKWQTIVCKIDPVLGTYGTYIWKNGQLEVCVGEASLPEDYNVSKFKFLEARTKASDSDGGILQLDNIAIYQNDTFVDLFAVDVTGITLNKTELALTVGAEETLSATIAPDNATDKTVSWTSTSDAVATVDANGKVTAVGVGSATITATTTNGMSATCAVTVTAAQTEESVVLVNGTDFDGTLLEAIESATEGAVITLLDDITESSIELNKKITLDLKGNILTATYFKADNETNVIDSSGDKKGRLVVAAENGTLATTNKEVPIYIADEGYMFATMLGQSSVSKTDDSFTVISRPSFGADYAAKLANGADAVKLDFIIRLDWGTVTDGKYQYYQEFVYNEDTVKAVYNVTTPKAFSVTVNELEDYKDTMKVTVLVRSTDLEVDWVNNEFYMSSASE